MELYLRIFAPIMLFIGIYAIVTTLLNLRHFRKLGNVEDKTEGPLISIVIPARNEEATLGRLLDSLIKQTYSNIEILVINDQSSDRTGDIIEEYVRKDPRIHGYSTDKEKKLNNNGKINALLQLIPHATGEYIITTDADTEHSTDCVAHAYSVISGHNLDIISGFPTEKCPSFWGLVSISAMMFTDILIPHFLVYRFPIPSASFAIGQFIMMKRESYIDCGGYSAIKGTICDDVGIVRLFVRKKKRYAFISIANYVTCHMYGSAKEAFLGIERSIAGVFPPKVTIIPITILLAIAVLHLGLSPILALLFLAFNGAVPEFWILLAGIAFFFIAWYIGCRAANWRKRISTAGSLTLIEIAAMYIHGLYKELSGKGFEWKGRNVK